MESPFTNDMFSMVYKAFKRLYPEKDCNCQWQPAQMTSADGKNVLGLTTYGDDGNVYVDISTNLKVVDAIEILAHELAHVAVGEEVEPHGEEWEEAFDAIHNEFDKIGNEMFDDDGVPVTVVSGKEYVRDSVIEGEDNDKMQ